MLLLMPMLSVLFYHNVSIIRIVSTFIYIQKFALLYFTYKCAEHTNIMLNMCCSIVYVAPVEC